MSNIFNHRLMVVLFACTLLFLCFVLPRIPSLVLVSNCKYCSYRLQFFSEQDDNILLSQVVEVDGSDWHLLKRILISPDILFLDHDYGWTDEHSLILKNENNEALAVVQIAYPWGCGFIRMKRPTSERWYYMKVDETMLKRVLNKYRPERSLIAG